MMNKPQRLSAKRGGRSLQRMVRRLARVSEDMRKLGADMDYYGGFGLLGDRGREMLGAARMANGWIKHLAKIARIVGGEGKRAQNVKPPNDQRSATADPKL